MTETIPKKDMPANEIKKPARLRTSIRAGSHEIVSPRDAIVSPRDPHDG